MATTGVIEGSSSSGTCFFSTRWFSSSGTVVWASAGTNSEITGFSGTISGTVTGVKVYLVDTYLPLGGTGGLDIYLSFDGGSNYSYKSSGNLSTTSSDDVVVGADDELITTGNGWSANIDLSSFTDLSDIRIKGVGGSPIVYSNHAEIEIFYEEAATATIISQRLRLSSGNLNLKAGKLKLK